MISSLGRTAKARVSRLPLAIPSVGGVRGGLCLLPLAIPSWEGLGVGYASCLLPSSPLFPIP
jgi:hypothetical protein